MFCTVTLFLVKMAVVLIVAFFYLSAGEIIRDFLLKGGFVTIPRNDGRAREIATLALELTWPAHLVVGCLIVLLLLAIAVIAIAMLFLVIVAIAVWRTMILVLQTFEILIGKFV